MKVLTISWVSLVLAALVIGGLAISPLFRAANAQQGGVQQPGALSAAAKQQINALLAEKQSRTPAQRKIGSQLLYAIKAQRGEAMTSGGLVRSLRSGQETAKTAERGPVNVDIRAELSKELAEVIGKLGGEVLNVSLANGSMRARLPLSTLEELAALPAVKSIRPAATAVTHHQLDAARTTFQLPTVLPFKITPDRTAGRRLDFNQRAANVRTQLSAAFAGGAVRSMQDGAAFNTGAANSQGNIAHRATEGRNFFGITGAGVKIGVLSDSVDFLDRSIASGDLPPDVTVLPGQSGVPGGGEGTAMLEIIHDVAPAAKLYFATAFNSIESFGDNIRALRAAGCDIIVDDIIYFAESPFHDDIVSTAVEEVTANGALYFSSAGNEGNFNDGTAGVWEGDFKDSGSTLGLLPGGTLHDFGNGVISNRVEVSSPFVLAMYWSDPAGASDNDYDLFIMNNTLTAVLDASTDIQDGDDNPFEITFGALTNQRIVIFKAEGAETRAIHINNFRGELALGTPGSTHGHNSAPGGFGVAAVNAALAGTGPFIGGPTNPVELFSSDGPRRVFYKSDGTAITPGNILFADQGGELRRKPDLAAADGVATTVPGFEQFFGTSAAAPHAAAIAALLKSAKPRLTPGRIRQALVQTAMDIEAAGNDRDSGVGIIDAFAALQFVGAAPSPFLDSGTVTTAAVGGDGDTFIEPGESGRISIPVVNIGGATALGVRVTVTTATPGVTITSGSSNYPNIGSNGQTATNLTPLTFALANNAACGLPVVFTASITYTNSNVGPLVFTFRVQTGQPDTGNSTFSYTGPALPIPDVNPVGVSIPITVSGMTSPIGGLRFRFDGSSCSSAIGATTVGLDHTWIGDLLITLTSPQGTTVTLTNQPGGVLTNGGNNFCNTVFDDAATASIQSITPLGAPYTGSFRPVSPLAAFNGENGNGTWTLKVVDTFGGDTGNVRAFSLVFSSFVCSTP
ncbi:MAG TPA: proprotein convertase P-domain-containing protein [Blastocatellia bacterium]|nr:proprotein convertase P-domain-containing protein [Blastocatellia bacterium]